MASALKSLTRGSRALTEGLRALGEEGLRAVVDETAGIGVSISRKDALLALAEEYTSFTCTRPNPGDTVQFVLTTEEIAAKAPLENTPRTSPSPGSGGAGESAGAGEDFFARLGKWFGELFASIRGWFA